MAFINIGTGDDLVLEIPVKRTVDWADKLREDCFQRIVEHDHSGSGRGRPLAGQGIADNGIDDRKILLRNNEWLRSAGQQGDPDQNILRVTPAGELEIGPQKLVMSNGVVLDNNGADSSRIEGEITISDDLHLESNLLGPNLIQTSGNGIVSTKNVHLDPSTSDPVGPMDGQLQYSDGVHRAAGLWQYQNNQWVNIQGEVGANSVNTAAIQNEAVTGLKMANDSVPTRAIVNDAVTLPKVAPAIRSLLRNTVYNLASTYGSYPYLNRPSEERVFIDVDTNISGKTTNAVNTNDSAPRMCHITLKNNSGSSYTYSFNSYDNVETYSGTLAPGEKVDFYVININGRCVLG